MYKIYYLNCSLIVFFYTAHALSSADSNILIIESSVLFTYVTRRQKTEGVVLLM